MKAITLRNLPPDLRRLIEKRARADRTSATQAVVHLLESALGLGRKQSRKTIHHDLDHLAGTWSKNEARAFDQALADQRHIDPELWK